MKKTYYLFVVLIVLLPVACFSGCGSGEEPWVSTGGSISNCQMVVLGLDSQNGVLFAGGWSKGSTTKLSAGIGVWRYDGSTWKSTAGAISSYSIYSLAYDSAHNLLYAGTSKDGSNTGVWKYDGATWADVSSSLSGKPVVCLLYDSERNVLYAGTDGGVWKYDGFTWVNTGGAVSGYQIASLACDSAHNVLYAGTDSQGVWKYDGTTWTSTKGAVSDRRILSLSYDPEHRALYAGTQEYGVWKYNGSAWTNTEGAVKDYLVSSLAYDSNHNLLYAASTYSGANYQPGKANPLVWKYDGQAWTSDGGGLPSEAVYSLAYDSSHDVLYAGVHNGVWFKTSGKPNHSVQDDTRRYGTIPGGITACTGQHKTIQDDTGQHELHRS